MQSVPFVDLRRQHCELEDELRSAFDRVLDNSGFVLGSEVEEFEERFARFCGVDHCVGVASGTAALTLSILAAGIGPGDEVIVPAHTYIATALAVSHAGAQPVFCDVDDANGLIDVHSAAEAVTSRTAAIVPVHLYGQTCDMDAVRVFAGRHGLVVVEDAAQAHGARFGAERAGSLGDVAGFSFFPSKNLGALGDGGAICTNDSGIAESARRLRNLGQRVKGEHESAGYNERLDGLQAAMLSVKLDRLDDENAVRRLRAATYRDLLPADCRLLDEDPRNECVYHLFPVRLDRRDDVRDRLQAMEIATGVHYWPAVPDQRPFAACRRTAVPNAERWAGQELSLPMFSELTEQEVHRVSEALAETLNEMAI
jgi:dTDP-4-amino-4,6-dideoxygalactose transaminase